MNKLYHGLKVSCFVLMAIIMVQSCSDEAPSPITQEETTGQFNLYLTDCPFDAEEVNVEIISVILEDDDGNEEVLSTNAGIYNLLEFTDGVDTLIASGNIDLDDIENIYFELGDQNTIVVDGVTHPLELKDGNRVKVKVNLDKIDDDDYLVDFFACTSIIKNNNGYFLKPVIKFKGKRINNGDNDLIEDLFEDLEDCYELVFPISLIDKDSLTSIANDDEELIEILLDNEIKGLVYPINLLDKDGNTVTLNSSQDAGQLEDCDDDDDDDDNESEIEEIIEDLDDCYELVFPVELIDKDDTKYTANDESDLEEIIDDYKISDFVYPISLTDLGGEVTSISHLDQLKNLEDDCDEDDDDDDDDEELEELFEDLEDCYELVYPVELVDKDDTKYTANDENELEEIIDDYKISDFVYPISLTDQDGEITNISDLDQLKKLEDDCDDDDDDDDDDEELEELFEDLEDCYDIIYPISFITDDGEMFSANDENEAEEILDDDDNKIIDFVYPLDLIDDAGNSVQVEDKDAIESLDLDC